MTTTRGDVPAPAPSGHDSTADQVEMVLDLEVGDYLPQFDAMVCAVDIRTERLGVHWVDLELTDGRTLTLDGHDDVTIGPRRRGFATLTDPEGGTAALAAS
ncbi:hypothetical protein BH09ACT8_BH09ACT8_55790 [soil metagenome]